MLKMADKIVDKKEPVVIKKYANRRLYNTETSTYVTLEDLAKMVREERDFVVYDAKSGDELTHAVLTQIIVEQECRAGGESLLPVPFLRQLIRFYGDTMQRMVPSYLQVSLDTLTREQDRFRKQFASAFTPQAAYEVYQEQARKNLVMFEKAMTMFTPFSGMPGMPGAPGAAPEGGEDAAKANGAHKPAAGTTSAGDPSSKLGPAVGNELAELKAQLAAMHQKIENMANGGRS